MKTIKFVLPSFFAMAALLVCSPGARADFGSVIVISPDSAAASPGAIVRAPASSTVADTLCDSEFVVSAGSDQGFQARNRGARGGGGEDYVDKECNTSGRIQSGTKGDLMAVLLGKTEKAIKSAGGSINGRGVSGGEAAPTKFSFRYRLGDKAGIVKVFSFEKGDGEIEVVIVSYEHRTVEKSPAAGVALR